MLKILANDGISNSGKKALKDAGFDLFEINVAQEQLPKFINENSVDVLLVRSKTAVNNDLIDACPGLKIIGRGGVELDNIDADYAKEKGLTVIHTPLASARSVAEMVFAHFLSLARFLHESNRMMPLEGDTQFNILKKSYAGAVELKGKTLGIIGFGGVGKEVAKLGISLGMKVKVHTRTPKTETLTLDFFDGQKLNFDISTNTDLEDFLQDVEFLSINTPKTDRYIIAENEFNQMKDGIFIVNTAQGGAINEMALIDAVEDGKVAGAALDVFENEPTPELSVLMNPALSLSPHLAGNTADAQKKIDLELANQLIQLQKNL